MHLYPAIDIKEGRCVRLCQGRFDQVRIYSDSPASIARLWEEQGASYLHLVDLDGALKGRSVNAACIREIVQSVSIPVQLGGGIRSLADMEEALALGVARAIIGTKAVEEPQLLQEAVRRFGAEAVAAGIDAKDGRVAVHGWGAGQRAHGVRTGPADEGNGRAHDYLYGYCAGRDAKRPQYRGDQSAERSDGITYHCLRRRFGSGRSAPASGRGDLRRDYRKSAV